MNTRPRSGLWGVGGRRPEGISGWLIPERIVAFRRQDRDNDRRNGHSRGRALCIAVIMIELPMNALVNSKWSNCRSGVYTHIVAPVAALFCNSNITGTWRAVVCTSCIRALNFIMAPCRKS